MPERLMPFDPEHWLEAAAVCCIEIPEVDREALLRTEDLIRPPCGLG